MWIFCKSYSWLPWSKSRSSGLLELKYIQTNDSESLREVLLRKKICVTSDNSIVVNTKQKCFYQIQLQMFPTSKEWTDFVVKGSLCKSLYIERVPSDPAFWKEVHHLSFILVHVRLSGRDERPSCLQCAL